MCVLFVDTFMKGTLILNRMIMFVLCVVLEKKFLNCSNWLCFKWRKNWLFRYFCFYKKRSANKKFALLKNFDLVTRARIELALPPWKGGVLTTWPTGHLVAITGFEPVTLRVWTACSSHLSYIAIFNYSKSTQITKLIVQYNLIFVKTFYKVRLIYAFIYQ